MGSTEERSKGHGVFRWLLSLFPMAPIKYAFIWHQVYQIPEQVIRGTRTTNPRHPDWQIWIVFSISKNAAASEKSNLFELFRAPQFFEP